MKSFQIYILCIFFTIFCFLYSNTNQENICLRRFLFNRSAQINNLECKPETFASFDSPSFEWMKEQINDDLSSSQLITKDFDSICSMLDGKKIKYLHIEVRNQHLLTKHEEISIRSTSIINGINELLEKRPLPDLECVICIEDSLDKNPIDQVAPIFTFAKVKNEPGLICMPDFTCFSNKDGSYAWHTHVYPDVEEGNRACPWNKKIPKAVWRGATTGIDFNSENWVEAPRLKLCLSSLDYEEDLDARFSYLSQMTDLQRKILKKILPLSRFMTPKEQVQYKYLISIDGNSCTYPGLHWRLLSNCVVLKQESENIQWYYRALIPYQHYIPLEKDLCNLKEQLSYVKQHDNQAEKIAKKATEFAKTNLSVDACFNYLEKLLIQYAQDFFPENYDMFVKRLSGTEE